MPSQRVKLYALSTCSHCRAVKRLLDERGAEYETVEVDLLTKTQRKEAVEQVRKYNNRVSFPTVVIGNRVIIGNKEEEIREALTRLRTE